MLHRDRCRSQPDSRGRCLAIECRKVHGVPADAFGCGRARDRIGQQRLRDQPREGGVAVGEHLLRLGIRHGVQEVGGIHAHRREGIRTETESTAGLGHERAHRLAADAVAVHQVIFERDRVEPPGDGIAIVARPLFDPALTRRSGERFQRVGPHGC